MSVNFESSEFLADGDRGASDLDALRKILVGPEQNRIEELSEEIRARELTAEELADKLPEAVGLSASRSEHLGRALGPTIDTALRESIRRDPKEMAAALFPVLGPAIRKAIAETMAGLVRSINHAVDQSLSVNGLKWRVEAWRTGVPFPEIVIKHALVYRVEQAFLIHAETGLLLEHVSAPDLTVPDTDLISSMLTAIQDFVRDSFTPGEGATLRTFSVGDHTVQVEAGPRALLALVIKGEAPSGVLRKQQDALETVHLEFAGQLADYNGDSTPFLPARPLLEDCLETVLSTGRGQRGAGVWMRWAVPLLVASFVLGGMWLRSAVRYDRGIAALKAEPGLVVVDSDRGWGSWTISGMRDPIAREPRAVLAAAGINPRALNGKWVSFLSLDPSITALRVRSSVDSIAKSIESDRILFAAGSSVLDQGALARLASLAVRYRQLEDAAVQSGGSIRLELVGRTDPSGADETNATLAASRVSAVASWLESLGIAAARLSHNAIATGRPLSAGDSLERARINRSVSFDVSVTTVSRTGEQ